MKLVKATQQDFQKITQFYRDVISRTEDMDVHARWEYGKHPTDERIRGYIRAGAMYYKRKGRKYSLRSGRYAPGSRLSRFGVVASPGG